MKIQSPWMGRVRGSAGQMTGAKMYDKNVLRAKAFEVNNPNTQAQQTQRSYFKQVIDLSQTLSPEQLRSLYPIKPKTMSRRNTLSKQLTKFMVDDGSDFYIEDSSLFSIGNGSFVNTECVLVRNGLIDVSTFDESQLNLTNTESVNLIFVIYDDTNKRIIIFNSDLMPDDIAGETMYDLSGDIGEISGFAYITCEQQGQDVSDRGFGSFIIKTRKESTGRGVEPTPATITIYANGTTEGSYFHFVSEEFPEESSNVPSEILNNSIQMDDGIAWDSEKNWWAGELNKDLNLDQSLEVLGWDTDHETGPYPATWVVQ